MKINNITSESALIVGNIYTVVGKYDKCEKGCLMVNDSWIQDNTHRNNCEFIINDHNVNKKQLKEK